jgi:hypothetical protein
MEDNRTNENAPNEEESSENRQNEDGLNQGISYVKRK